MSGLNVSVVAGKDEHSSHVKVEGSVQHIITDVERKSFNLDDSQLKAAIVKSGSSKIQPNDVYLHDPTPPHGDVYKQNNWEQATTIVAAESAKILEVTSKPVALVTKTLENDSNVEAIFHADLSESVSDTVTSSWNAQNTISVNQKIKYNIGFLGTGGGGETDFSYSHSWGEGGEESKTVTIGTSTGVSVTLKPNQAVEASLTASRGVMKVRVQYKARLTGGTVCYYNSGYQGYNIWWFWVPSVMMSADIPNSIEFTEDLEIGYYSGGKVEIKDKDTKEVIASHSLVQAIPGTGSECK